MRARSTQHTARAVEWWKTVFVVIWKDVWLFDFCFQARNCLIELRNAKRQKTSWCGEILML